MHKLEEKQGKAELPWRQSTLKAYRELLHLLFEISEKHIENLT